MEFGDDYLILHNIDNNYGGGLFSGDIVIDYLGSWKCTTIIFNKDNIIDSSDSLEELNERYFMEIL